MELGINVCLHRKFFQTAHPKRKFPFQSILAVLLWTVVLIYLFFSLSYPKHLNWTLALSHVLQGKLGLWAFGCTTWRYPKEGLKRNKDKMKNVSSLTNFARNQCCFKALAGNQLFPMPLPQLWWWCQHMSQAVVRRGHLWITEEGQGPSKTWQI